MKKIILSLLFASSFLVGFAQPGYDLLVTETAETATTVTLEFKIIATSTPFLLGSITIYMDQAPASLGTVASSTNTLPLGPYISPGFYVNTGLPGNQFSLNAGYTGPPTGLVTITTSGYVLGTVTFNKTGSGVVNLSIDQTFTEVLDENFTLVIYDGLASNGSIVLPLEWLSFKATPITTDGANKVALTWETASEKDVTNFNVERSDDGKVFTKIGASIPANNKVSKSSYTAYDDKPLSGVSYYRIRQTDVDGKTSVTKIESVTLNSKKAVGKFTFYPNPIQKGTPLSILTDVQGVYDFKVIDMTGKVMYNQKLQGNNIELKGLSLAAGTYLYEILSGEQRVSGKIFVAE